VTMQSFLIFTCEKLDSNRWFLSESLNEQCYETQHDIWMLLAGLPGMALYTFGIPAFGFYILYGYRYQLDDEHIMLMYGFLYEGYERAYYFWELWVMQRKVLVIFSAVFLAQIGKATQALGAFLVIMLSLTFHLRSQPYEDDDLDKLETVSLYVTTFTLWAGLFFYADELTYTPTLCLTFCIFMGNIIFCGWFLYFAYFDVKKKVLEQLESLYALIHGDSKKSESFDDSDSSSDDDEGRKKKSSFSLTRRFTKAPPKKDLPDCALSKHKHRRKSMSQLLKLRKEREDMLAERTVAQLHKHQEVSEHWQSARHIAMDVVHEREQNTEDAQQHQQGQGG
jgi:hypothetical protein